MTNATAERTVIKCPTIRCRGRFLAETEGDYLRVICPSCGSEIIYRSKKLRQEDIAPKVDNAGRPPIE